MPRCTPVVPLHLAFVLVAWASGCVPSSGPGAGPVFTGGSYTGSFSPFFGNLHAHTGYSDGKKTPREAFRYARDVAGLDFMAVTDHMERIYGGSFARSAAEADAENRPGSFVTLVGYEWGHGVDRRVVGRRGLEMYNHINVFTRSRLLDFVKSSSLGGFYSELTALPTGTVAQFNHPGIRKKFIEYNHFDDYRYDPRADAVMCLIRAEKGDNDLTKGYVRALDKGWHLSPTSNQDNHQADWGTRNEHRTGIWARALTRKDLVAGMREMRTFSTTDRNATIRLIADGTWWMGSVLATGAHTLEVEVGDPDASDRFVKIELFTSGGKVLHSISLAPGQTRWKVGVNPSAPAYYFARATQADGDELVSAPVWVR